VEPKLERPGDIRRYSETLRAGRSGDRLPVGSIYSTRDQTSPEAYPASYTMGTGTFLGSQQSGRGVKNPPQLSAEVKVRVQLYIPFWAFVACSRVNISLQMACN
jgi:hypothetical protein